MASIYQVGQYRFSGNCIDNLNNTYMLKTWPTSFSLNKDEEDSPSKMIFTDFAISPKGDTVTTFDADTDYYISIPIPVDFNTSYEFTIKLMKAADNEQDDTRGSYQFISNFSIAQTGNANNLYEIVLYNKNLNASAANYSDEEVVAQILTTDDIYNAQQHLPTNPQEGHLYYAGEKDWRDYYIYHITEGKGEYLPATKMVKASLYASWRTNQSTDLYSYIELVFRPVESGFRDLVFEMSRGSQDYGLINGITANADGSVNVVHYGRKVDISRIQDKWKIYRVNNIVPKITDGSPLERIGVWGHPGQIMAINGEQIKIGPSGYYELEGLDVSSFGVVAENDQYKRDGFTLDYGYYSKTED